MFLSRRQSVSRSGLAEFYPGKMQHYQAKQKHNTVTLAGLPLTQNFQTEKALTPVAYMCVY